MNTFNKIHLVVNLMLCGCVITLSANNLRHAHYFKKTAGYLPFIEIKSDNTSMIIHTYSGVFSVIAKDSHFVVRDEK